jgi:histidine triad (HIT) family protein
MSKTLFERIIEGELPSEKIYEDERVIAIKDIAPKAPIHILIIPKKVIPDIQSMQPEDFSLLGDVAKVAQKIAKDLGLVENGGYRLLTNNGKGAGQTIFHLHFHLLGGRPLGEMG